MAAKMTYAPFREPEGITIDKEETAGNGLDKGMALSVNIEEIIEKHGDLSSGQKISPKALYRAHLPPGVESETPKTIKLIENIHQSLTFLASALHAENEIERESIMNSFSESIFELTFFPSKSKEFKDSIHLIHTAVEAHKKDPYNRKEILVLQEVLNQVRQDLHVADETLDKCVDLLETAGFDINAPIGEIELNL